MHANTIKYICVPFGVSDLAHHKQAPVEVWKIHGTFLWIYRTETREQGTVIGVQVQFITSSCSDSRAKQFTHSLRIPNTTRSKRCTYPYTCPPSPGRRLAELLEEHSRFELRRDAYIRHTMCVVHYVRAHNVTVLYKSSPPRQIDHAVGTRVLVEGNEEDQVWVWVYTGCTCAHIRGTEEMKRLAN